MRAFALLACASAVIAQGPTPAPQPKMTCFITSNGATYDLNVLAQSGGFTFTDNRNNDDDNAYAYQVSVCNDMQPVDQCATTTGSDGRVASGPAPAFQICTNPAVCGNACYRLGDTAANGQINVFGRNPAHGVAISYANGDACTITSGGTSTTTNRSINLIFLCKGSSGLLPASNSIVEDVTCRYTAMIYSPLGCPLQCPFGGTFGPGKLCGGHGICDYNTSASAPSCFCDKGYSGVNCMVPGDAGLPPPKSYAPNIAIGVIVGSFVGIAVMLGFVLGKSLYTRVTFFSALDFFGAGGGAATGATSNYTQAPAFDSAPTFATPVSPFGGTATTSDYKPPTSGGGLNDGPLLA